MSPATGELKAALGAVASSLATARGLRAFKVGANARGLRQARQASLVYFERLDDLRAGADTLTRNLGSCQAHGVPITAEMQSPTGC